MSDLSSAAPGPERCVGPAHWPRWARISAVCAAVAGSVVAFFWPYADDLYAGLHYSDSWTLLQRAMAVRDVGSAAAFVLRLHSGQFVPLLFGLFLAGHTALGTRLYPALRIASVLWHGSVALGGLFLLRRNLRETGSAVLGIVVFGTSYGTFGVLRDPYWALGKGLSLALVVGALVFLELHRTSKRFLHLVASGLMCVLAPATISHGIVAAPLALLYGVLVVGARGRYLRTLLLVYGVALLAYIVPYLALHAHGLLEFLTDNPTRGTVVTASPLALGRWTVAVMAAMPVKEWYLPLFRFGGSLEWLRWMPMLGLGATVLLAVAGVATKAGGLRGLEVRRLVRFGAFCLLAVFGMVLLIGLARFSYAGSITGYMRGSRWHYATMFFFGAGVAVVADPAFSFARRALGSWGPVLLVVVLAGTTLAANRVAIGRFDRAVEKRELSPDLGVLIEELRTLRHIARQRAALGQTTVLPSVRLPGKARVMELRDVDAYAGGREASPIRWVGPVHAEWGLDGESLLEQTPALREFLDRYYFVGPPTP